MSTLILLADFDTDTCLDCDDDLTPAEFKMTRTLNGSEFRVYLCGKHAAERRVLGWQYVKTKTVDRSNIVHREPHENTGQIRVLTHTRTHANVAVSKRGRPKWLHGRLP